MAYGGLYGQGPIASAGIYAEVATRPTHASTHNFGHLYTQYVLTFHRARQSHHHSYYE